MEKNIFERKKIVTEKALAFGFAPDGDGLFYSRDFLSGDFSAEVRVAPDGTVSGKVIDRMNDEEYAPLRAEGMRGAFVSSVRAAYAAILEEIARECCDDFPFASDQANRIAKAIGTRYKIAPDFPFDEEPHRTSGVFRHADSGKWFGLIMRIRKSVLAGETDPARIDVMNLKADPAKIPDLLTISGVYPAYHMNRKYWISLALDERVEDRTAMELIESSFLLTDKKRTR